MTLRWPALLQRQTLELLSLLVLKELRLRYKSSVLGYIWAVANPFAFALVYYVAFKLIMRVDVPNYSIFLLSGMFPWLWFTTSMINGTNCYRNGATLVKKVKLNRAILPLSHVMHEMVHFCLALPILVFFMLISKTTLHWSWLYQLPFMLIVQLLVMYPVVLILSVANVFVRDVEYLVSVGITLLFFLTPVVYPLSMVPEQYQIYFEISPPARLLEAWRSMFLQGQLAWGAISFCLGFSALMTLIAIWVQRKLTPKIGELL
jgi:lipopolysaccharide transport system permease protein